MKMIFLVPVGINICLPDNFKIFDFISAGCIFLMLQNISNFCISISSPALILLEGPFLGVSPQHFEISNVVDSTVSELSKGLFRTNHFFLQFILGYVNITVMEFWYKEVKMEQPAEESKGWCKKRAQAKNQQFFCNIYETRLK